MIKKICVVLMTFSMLIVSTCLTYAKEYDSDLAEMSTNSKLKEELSDDEFYALVSKGQQIAEEKDFSDLPSDTVELYDFLENDDNDGEMSLFSVQKKAVAYATSYYTDTSKSIAKSPIVQKGMTASVSYKKTMSATFRCNVQIPGSVVSGAVGFDVLKNYTAAGSASKKATHKGYLELNPRYKVVKFKVYMKSRRGIGKDQWVYCGQGQATKPDNLVARFINTN